MTKLDWCEAFVWLNGRLISFAEREYLRALYAAQARRIVLRCSRQTEKSTFLALTILHLVCTQPGIRILYVCPRIEQARTFIRLKLHPLLLHSPLIRTALLGRRGKHPGVEHLVFRNRSELYVRAAFHSADASRGLSVDVLMVDEFQDSSAGDLPVLQETLSHAPNPCTILTGTPKTIDNHLEAAFRRSTANEWTITCSGCQKGAILDTRALGLAGLACPDCQTPLDRSRGRWVPRNPGSTWGAGYWIGHPLVPWMTYDEILERQQTYDLAHFKNECLGLPTELGDHVVTRAELAACCRDVPLAERLAQIPAPVRRALVAGIDWGGGSVSPTVLVIGYMDREFRFHVVRFETFAADEDPGRIVREIAQRCRAFQISQIAADGGGNGSVYNRLLLQELGPGNHRLFAILYSVSDQAPQRDGYLVKCIVGRTASIGTLFGRIKSQKLFFPRESECGSFLEEFAGVIAAHDDLNRTIQYQHPETQPDDAMHAANYALLLATYLHNHRP